MRKDQSGVMLLEALIAILIFSLGILGVVGMQASAVNASRDAKYRSDAALLANELIGEMWSGDRIGLNLQNRFQGDCDDALGAVACNYVADGNLFLAWRNRVRATLPGADTNDPFVYVGPVVAAAQASSGCPPGDVLGLGAQGTPQTSTTVCIVVRWRAPSDPVTHSYRVDLRII